MIYLKMGCAIVRLYWENQVKWLPLIKMRTSAENLIIIVTLETKYYMLQHELLNTYLVEKQN